MEESVKMFRSQSRMSLKICVTFICVFPKSILMGLLMGLNEDSLKIDFGDPDHYF